MKKNVLRFKPVLSMILALVMISSILPWRTVDAYGTPPTVQVIYTSNDLSNKLTAQNGLTFGAYDSSNGIPIYVNPNITYQSFEGFGSSFEGSSVYNLSQLSDTNRNTVMQDLFDPSAGAGWNLMRICFGTCDFSSDFYYTYDDVPAGQTDENLSCFSIQEDINRHIIARVKDAIAKNPDTRIFASAWSPPAWMKDNQSLTNGGHVLRQYYPILAQYYCKAIQAYAAQGIPIYAMTVQNEPGIPTRYPSCEYTAEEERDFVKVLANELRKNDLQTKIWIYDESFSTFDGGSSTINYISTILSDKAAFAAVDGIGFHDYNSVADCSLLSSIHQLYPTVPMYLTERSTHYEDGADRIVQYFRNYIKSYSAWLTFLDDQGLPDESTKESSSHPGVDPPQPVRAEHGNLNNWRLTSDYYMYGQFSKYIQRGAVRIDSDAGSASTVTNVAFKNPDGSIVMVVVNQTTMPQAIKILTDDGQVTNTIPAKTVATFKWVPNTHTALKRDGWNVTASLTAWNSSTSFAMDSNGSSRWTSGVTQAPNQYIQVNMGKQKRFNAVTFDAGADSTDDYARGYEVRVSNDGNNWWTVAAGSGKCRLIHAEFSPQTAQYIRIVQTGTSNSRLWSVSEINVEDCETNAAFNQLPGKIEGENYYMASPSGVQIIGCNDPGGAGAAVNLSSNAWADYNIDAATAGTYAVQLRVNAAGNGQLQMLRDGSLLSTVLVNATGSQSWQTVETEITLDAGKNTIRVMANSGSFSVNNIKFIMNSTPLSKHGWTATAYTSAGADTPSNAIDENIHTRWSNGWAQENNNQWFQLDFGVSQTFTSVVLDAGESIGDMGRQIDVYVSDDGSNWGTSIASQNCTAQSMKFYFQPVNARYVKFVQTGTATDHYWSIHDIEVYNTTSSRVLERGDWKALAYQTGGSDVPSNALDGNSSTRWSNGEAQTPANQWFEVDMGRQMLISKISADSGSNIGDYARGCTILISGDEQNWTTLLNNSSGNGQIMQFDFPPCTARYIKLVQTGTAGDHYWSIDEFNVYGKESMPISAQMNYTHWTEGSNSIIKIDLLSAQTHNEILLYPTTTAASIPSSYAVYVMDNGNTLSNAVAQGNFYGKDVRITYPPKTARFIEIVLTGTNNTDLWNTYGFDLFNTNALTALPTLGWTASAYKTNGADDAGNAIDGVFSTRWANGEAQMSSGQWFQIDMNTARTFSAININSDLSTGDYPRGYAIRVSNDGINWGSSIANGILWSSDITVTFSPQQARYIRIYQTGSASDHYWSIHELNIYNSLQ